MPEEEAMLAVGMVALVADGTAEVALEGAMVDGDAVEGVEVEGVAVEGIAVDAVTLEPDAPLELAAFASVVTAPFPVVAVRNVPGAGAWMALTARWITALLATGRNATSDGAG
ncbi:MAG TPA: hypothetical protein VLP43_06345, partial [Solirubrobacteraceae bacterium]|nr:hypothetical protein [Solirubrobacteraceae bacterium]